MSYSNVYTLNVDLKQTMTSVVPTFAQDETGVLRFRLFDDGKELDTAPYTYSEIVHKLPSGNKIMGNLDLVTIDGEKLLEYRYTGMEMAELGKVEVQLVIQSANTQVAIRPFKIVIYDNMRDDDLTYVGILQELIAEVSLLKEEMYKAINSWEWRDSYDNDIQYYRHNVVEYQGSSWIALRDTKGNPPPTLPTISNLNWYLIARKADGGINQTDFDNHINLKATTTQYGHTKLNNTLTSNSTEEAATASTVKRLNDNNMYNSRYGFNHMTINDSNMSSTNFEANINLLFENIPNRTNWTIYAEQAIYPNLTNSIRKKLFDDLAIPIDTSIDYLMEFTTIGNKYIPNKILIYPNSVNGMDNIYYINWDKSEELPNITNKAREYMFRDEFLNKFEEGSWTPTVIGNSGSALVSIAHGNYRKVGREVFVSFIIQKETSDSSNLTGDFKIGGLPFASNYAGGSVTIGFSRGFNITEGTIQGNTSIADTISFNISKPDGSFSTLNSTHLSSSFRLVGSMTYCIN